MKNALLVSHSLSVWLSGNMLSLSNSSGINLRNLPLTGSLITCLNLDGVTPPSNVMMVRDGNKMVIHPGFLDTPCQKRHETLQHLQTALLFYMSYLSSFIEVFILQLNKAVQTALYNSEQKYKKIYK